MRLSRDTQHTCTSAGRVTSSLLLSFLVLSNPIAGHQLRQQQQQPLPILPPFPHEPQNQPVPNGEHVFTLRHVFHHGNLNKPALHHRHDIPKDAPSLWIESEDGPIQQVNRPLVVKAAPVSIQRLKDRRPSVVDPMVAAARQYSGVWASSPDAWIMDSVPGPDVTNMETILSFAQMAANAYVEAPNTGDWKDVGGGFNRTDDRGFGWDGNSLRGYLYTDQKNTTIVIGLKGTSLAIWDGDGTTTNDKENDNLFFSCCCGQQGGTFSRQVCDCATGTYTCNITCLKNALTKENRYYAAARHLYNNVTALYPDADIWLAGHSLGGSLSAMIGLTYGRPVLTFQAVPDALPANRLGLPVPPGTDPDRPGQREFTGAFHFGQNADPIFMGTCNGATASCSYAGYALESACHSGRECVFDVVKDNATRVSVVTHKIIWVIENVIKKYTKAPECRFTPECYDCPLWKEVTGNKSESSTSATSTSQRTKTRTTTCKTPGWWGCLDETTTSSGKTTSSITTTTSSTSTCLTPGWFGCNDQTATTARSGSFQPTPTKTSSSSSSSSTPTTSCKTPGWWGCSDPTTTSHPPASHSHTSTECQTPGFLWGCNDATTTTTTQSHAITSPPSLPTSAKTVTHTATHSCTSSAWFGLICVDPSPVPTSTSVPGKKEHCLRRSWLGWCNEWSSTTSNERDEI